MMPRYPMKPVPHGYFVAPVELLSDGSTGYAAGLVFYGDDEGDGKQAYGRGPPLLTLRSLLFAVKRSGPHSTRAGRSTCERRSRGSA